MLKEEGRVCRGRLKIRARKREEGYSGREKKKINENGGRKRR